jgi:hypothetical protein
VKDIIEMGKALAAVLFMLALVAWAIFSGLKMAGKI